MGYAPELYELLTRSHFPPQGYDQRYYGEVFSNEQLRQRLQIKLDYRSELFMNLGCGALTDFELRFRGNRCRSVFSIRCNH